MSSSTETHFRKLEQMYLAAPFNQYFEPTIKIEAGQAEVVITVQPKMFHTGGSAHGAVFFKMMDDSAYFAAASLIEDVFLVTSTFNIYFMRPVFAGEIRAVGTAVHQSRRLLIAESVVYDEAGQEVGRGSGQFMPTKQPLPTEFRGM